MKKYDLILAVIDIEQQMLSHYLINQEHRYFTGDFGIYHFL